MAKAKSVIDVILGEAVRGTRRQRYDDMVAIASVIANRARQLGVTPEQVVSAPGEFSAYNKDLPAGVSEFRELAHQALSSVEINGPVHNATFYATPAATKNLPKGLTQVGETTGHQYFSDPKNRAIQTSVGYVTPMASLPAVSSAPASIPQSINAGPAGRAYSDLVAPRAVSTTMIGAPDLPSNSASPAGLSLGMEALAPHGLIEKYGPNRPNRPNESIIGIADKAVKDVLGSDWSAVATSGMEDPGEQYGSTRHKTGNAVDVYAANTRTGQVATHEQMADIAQQAAALGATGVGFGAGYMDVDGISKMHIDTARPNNPASWGAGNTRTTMDPAERAAIMGGMQFGTPGFNPDRETGGIPVPADNPRKEFAGLQAMQDKREYERPSFAAPLGQVERTALSDVPSASPAARAAFDAAAAGFAAPDSLPPDRPMPSGPIGLADSWSPQKAIAGIIDGLPSLPSPSGMPLGSNIQNVAAAGPKPDLSRLTISQPAYSLSTPSPAPNVSPSLLSPDLMAPALNAPTEVRDNFISPVPGVQASPTVSPTPALPEAPAMNEFPEAPAAPSKWDKFQYAAKPVAKNALIGNMLAGPLGALGGAAIGLMGDRLPSFGGMLGPTFDRAAPDRFSTGFGLPGIMGAMGGPLGVQGFSASNPGMSFTSLGNGMGLRRSDKFGWTEVVGPGGEVRGIQYDNPNQGGLLGSISRAMGKAFGGSGKNATKAERASFAGKAGLY